MAWTGGCLCGAVRYRADADPFRAVHCHCAMCRKFSGAAFLTMVAFRAESFAWTTAKPARYRSSAQAERGFCPRCGSALAIFEEALPDWASVTLGSLDKPEDVRPADHIWTDSHLSWLRIEDDLPRYPRHSPEGGIEDP